MVHLGETKNTEILLNCSKMVLQCALLLSHLVYFSISCPVDSQVNRSLILGWWWSGDPNFVNPIKTDINYTSKRRTCAEFGAKDFGDNPLCLKEKPNPPQPIRNHQEPIRNHQEGVRNHQEPIRNHQELAN